MRAVNANGASAAVSVRVVTLDVPPAPTNFTATLGVPSGGQTTYNLSWTAPTLSANMPPINDQFVFVNSSDVVRYHKISVSATTYTFQASGTVNTIAIYARNVIGQGASAFANIPTS